ncbi:MAG: (d)CMP kinase, partial [Armatimonadota bacterium]
MKLTIAIDGPAGAGKSTVAKLVAEKLGLVVLDTGAMYRAVALIALKEGVQDDPHLVSQLAADTVFEMGQGTVVVNGQDVSAEIRTLEVGQWASKLSTNPEVREALVAKQRIIAQEGGFVLEGRDVTTVVAPNATLKVFLTASIEERARRRWLELKKDDTEIR